MKSIFNLLFLLSGVGAFFHIPIAYTRNVQYAHNRKYPISRYGKNNYLNQMKTRNATANDEDDDDDEVDDMIGTIMNNFNSSDEDSSPPGIRIVINKEMFQQLSNDLNNQQEDNNNNKDSSEYYDLHGNRIRSRFKSKRNKKSENFEVIDKSPINFKDVGGYDNIKLELNQCIDILSNYTKYAAYNVRTPKGIIFEGPPGNGKTLIAKALAGEANTAFITVSGSEFQEKYVGVGSSRIRELFELAKENVPCIIFIDEIDALGRQRSKDGELSGTERDSTLNELLVALDGFKNTSGVFLIGATNRADLLDSALVRPGRIDKRIYIGNPDTETRKAILNIHIKGKPYDESINIDNIVELTNGFSAAQIENVVNEAMLNALRYNRYKFDTNDLNEVINKMMVGWQPTEHQLTGDMIEQIAVHEMGHAVVGLLAKHHSKMKKVVLNLSSPKSPGYTIFESSNFNYYTREALFEHLMILLSGRIAEEVFYGVSVTTGAINDFEEALKLANNMICYYGMGKQLIYPSTSEKYKEIIDNEVISLINDAYGYAEFIILNSKELIAEGAEKLEKDKELSAAQLLELMDIKYKSVLNLKI